MRFTLIISNKNTRERTRQLMKEKLKKWFNSSTDMPKPLRKGMLPFCYAMVAIAVINFIIFYLVVNFNSILLAFKEFVGYDEYYNEIYQWSTANFERFFKEIKLPNSTINVAVKNTIKYFLANILITIPASYLVSYLLFKKVKGYSAFRFIFFLPSVISAAVYVTVFKNFISVFGPLDMILSVFGYKLPALLNTPETATSTIIAYTIWTGLGINMILYEGAMKRVPKDILEACTIDGGTWYHELFHVITPLVWPTLSTTIILAITGLFVSSGPILLFSEAGTVPGGNDTTTIAFFIFQKTQQGGALEYPAAIGVFFTLISIPIVVLIRKVFKKIDPEVEY